MSQATHMRSHPAPPLPPQSRTKRRSSQACLSCRSLKVRCDVVTGGIPCTNCRLDHLSCEVKDPLRRRRPSSTHNARKDVVEAAAVERAATGQQLDCHTHARHQSSIDGDEVGQMEGAHTQTRRPNSPPLSACPEVSEHFDSPPLPQQQHQHQNGFFRPQGPQTHHLSPSFQFSGYDSLHFGPRQFAVIADAAPQLPRYIKPIPQHLDEGDLQYMARKLCFEIPDDEFRDELLRVYISIVYPLIPAIDLENFIKSIKDNDGQDPVSLLLFQSIMFVSIAFVDEELLIARGHASRKAARKHYFERIRILYSLNYEKDRLALTQALLMMTYWYDAPDDDQDTWYWMGIALTIAQVAGFHRDPSAAIVPHQVNDAHLRRRIWWCCIMRDSLLALGLRRPSRIRDDEYNVSSLSEEDFDLRPPSARLVALFRNSKFPCPSMNSRRCLAFRCIELSKLCLTINIILRTHYTTVGAYYGGSEYLLDGPHRLRRTGAQVSSLAQCSQELKDWLRRQDARSIYVPGAESSPKPSVTVENGVRKINITEFHHVQLHMLYLAALNALNKPHVFSGSPNCDESGHQGQRQPRETVRDGTIDMTKLAFDLQRNDQLRYLTTTAVPAFLAVCLAHLLNVQQHDEKARNLSLGRLYQSVHVLQQLQSIYSAADYAICFLNSVLKNIQLRVPLLSIEENTIYQRHDGAKSAIDMGPSDVAAACMYPSPSASAHFSKNADDVQSASSDDSAMHAWDLQEQGDLVNMGGVGHFDEFITSSPYLSPWCDPDNMISTLANVDDNNGGS